MNIMLAQFGKIKFSELAESIRNIDEAGINGLAGVNNLLDNLPSGEETSAVLSYVEGGGDPGLLGKAELFTFAISKVDGVVHRLEAMRTRCTFADDVDELQKQVATVEDATRAIAESDHLRQFLRMLLTIGNKMNAGTAKGAATGFKIGALAKITQTKTNQGTTLLEYLLSSLRVNRPEMLELPRDLAPASAAARVNLSAVTTDLRKIEKQIDSMGDMIDRGASKGDYSYVENLERFHSHAKNTVLEKVKARFEQMKAQFDETVKMFGDDPAKLDSTEKWFGYFVKFAEDFAQTAAKLKRVEDAKEQEKVKTAAKAALAAKKAAKKLQAAVDGGEPKKDRKKRHSTTRRSSGVNLGPSIRQGRGSSADYAASAAGMEER